MKIELINTGTELLLGSTLNTHGAWIGQILFGLGLRVDRLTVVPDGEAIFSAIAESASRASVLFVTGGLGPTSDDITREALARVFGLKLKENQDVVSDLKEFFAKRGREMARENLKQAQVPDGARVLPNPNGTAPGIFLPAENGRTCAVFLFPGPPRELQPMFLEQVMPWLKSQAGTTLPEKEITLKTCGIGESDLHAKIDAALHAIPELEIGYCARLDEVDIRLIGSQVAVNQAMNTVLASAPEFVFSIKNQSLEASVVDLLKRRGMTLAIAESCTGGLVAKRITDIPGSSSVLKFAWVTYGNEAKSQLLGVSENLLKTEGAVSEKVVREMAQNALKISEADISIAVSGIAGPDGGSPEKPVGTVWLAWSTKAGTTFTRKRLISREREAVRFCASQELLDGIRRIASNLDLRA